MRSPGRPIKITPPGFLLHLTDSQRFHFFAHLGNSTKRYYTWSRSEKCRSGCDAQVSGSDFSLGETQGRRFRARFRFLRFSQNASLEAPCKDGRDLGADRNSPKSTICFYSCSILSVFKNHFFAKSDLCSISLQEWDWNQTLPVCSARVSGRHSPYTPECTSRKVFGKCVDRIFDSVY